MANENYFALPVYEGLPDESLYAGARGVIGELVTGAAKGAGSEIKSRISAGRKVSAECATKAAQLRNSIRLLAHQAAALETSCPEMLTEANIKRLMGALEAIDQRIATVMGVAGQAQQQQQQMIPPSLRSVPQP